MVLTRDEILSADYEVRKRIVAGVPTKGVGCYVCGRVLKPLQVCNWKRAMLRRFIDRRKGDDNAGPFCSDACRLAHKWAMYKTRGIVTDRDIAEKGMRAFIREASKIDYAVMVALLNKRSNGFTRDQWFAFRCLLLACQDVKKFSRTAFGDL